jgi:thioredoxin reductase
VPPNRSDTLYDVIIIGGGPAGLSAAFWLARYRRSVRVFDVGDPRNEPAWAVHGYPGVPDVSPLQFRRTLREQALAAGAEFSTSAVESVEGREGNFSIQTAEGEAFSARRVLLAYGLRDDVPEIPGIEEVYGLSVFHCPDCDGPSIADARIGLIGWDRPSASVALFLLTWTDRITLLTHGHKPDLDGEQRAALENYDIPIRQERITRLVSHAGKLSTIEFEGADSIELDALFFHYRTEPNCNIAQELGCKREGKTTLVLDSSQETSVPGVYGAGDLAGPPYLTISAAAGGTRVAMSIHRSLIPKDRFLDK